METERFQLIKGLSNQGIMVNVANPFINNDSDRRHDTNDSLNSKNTRPIRKSTNKEVKETKSNCNGRSADKIYYAAPGCLGNSWDDLEKEAFLLDILSFYYGEFYRSAAHSRWSSSRNKDRRSRRCIQGPKMFKTLRQHKFLSSCNVSLEDYVSTLTATIGLAMLVEIFAIGKGKQDLTGLVTDPARNNQQVISHPEIPDGKGCSALTLDEIVGFLTGDYPVWPRLLARGWQSKQPKNHTVTSSKNPLVFIVPGVKKFSRRKLVKGDLIALDPRLIELEDEPGKGNIGSQENNCDNKKMKPDEGDLMKFTVIDTSMGDGEDWFPVRDLRSLPVQTTETSFSGSFSSHNENGFKELAYENGVVDMPLYCRRDTNTSRSSEGITDKEVRSDSLKFIITVSKKEMQIKAPVRTDVSLHNDIEPIKSQFSRRKKPSQSNCMSPSIKRWRLISCCEVKAICSKDNSSRTRGLREEDPHLYLGSSNASNNTVSEVTQSQDKAYSSSSGKGSPDENFFGKYFPFIKEVEISQSDPSFKHPPSPASSELAGAEQQLPGLLTRRQGTRKRPLTAKALEALACGVLTTKRKPR
ncbi:hypothetical protein MKX01_035822 [Papaver californicum]|nr:hypothetical protein MKX01_035822 [Papaver californicum]